MATRVLARTTAREITFNECALVAGAEDEGCWGFTSYTETYCGYWDFSSGSEMPDYIYVMDDGVVSDRDV